MDISEIIEKDPELITDQDLETLVTYLRAQRSEWNKKEAKPKAPKKSKQEVLKDIGDIKI